MAEVHAKHRDMVQYLLEHGANPNSYGEPQGDRDFGPTPLDLVTGKDREKIRQLLLRFGANYSKTD